MGRRVRLSEIPPPPAPRAQPKHDDDDTTLPADVIDDDRAFLESIADAVPRDTPPKQMAQDAPVDAVLEGRVRDDEAEAWREFEEMAAGKFVFHVSDTDEYIEGCVEDLDRRVVKELHNGVYSRQAELDVHGLTRDEAHDEIRDFIERHYRAGLRCVKIIHGRGLHSKDMNPVLKQSLKSWLSRGRMAKIVLAFTSAMPNDGGAGAIYVLLRRSR